MSRLDNLKETIRQELPQLDCVIGWQQGFDPLHANPLFIRKAEDVDRLVVGPLCAANTATFLPSLKGKKVGIVVKGCDSRSVVELLQEKLVKREELVIFGLPCDGVLDLAKVRRAVGDAGPITAVDVSGDRVLLKAGGKEFTLALKDVSADKCFACRDQGGVIADHFIGERVEQTAQPDVPHPDQEAFEKLSLEERFEFWREQMSRCIRCYACRNACPMCVCRDHCLAQSRDPNWIGQDDSVKEKTMFQLVHVMHLAGRCTECGECQRACPMGIPLMIMKRHMNKVVSDLFEYKAGMNPDETPPLLTFKAEEENVEEREW